MKTIKILSLFVILAAFTGCKDDSGPAVSRGIQVVKSNAVFEPKGGNGSVEVDQAITSAYVSEDWVTATANGKVVTLEVMPNVSSRESRNAKLIIKSATDSVVVAVSQYGYIFNSKDAQNITVNNSRHEEYVPVTSLDAVTIISCPSWVTPSVEKDGISLSISENTTGKLRTGDLVFQAGGFQDAITITQFDAKENLFGTYVMEYYDTSMKQYQAIVEVSEDALAITSLGVSVPATFDYETNTLSIDGLSPLGEYSVYYLYLLYYNMSGSLTLSKNPGIFSFEYYPEYGDFIGELTNQLGMVVGAFKEDPPTAAGFVGSLASIIYPTLYRYNQESE
ncbi:MAG: BACON domain-containing protein [Bacteroidaceae bacterium]|nr:BACON domain-containing protein [Bacteroidaceae bacterium]